MSQSFVRPSTVGILSAGNWKILKTSLVRSSAAALGQFKKTQAPAKVITTARRQIWFTRKLPHVCAAESILDFACQQRSEVEIGRIATPPQIFYPVFTRL